MRINRDGVRIIEPYPNLKNVLRLARTVTNVENGVGFVRAANPTAAAVIIHKNTKIVWAVSVLDSQCGTSVSFQESLKSIVNLELGPHLS